MEKRRWSEGMGQGTDAVWGLAQVGPGLIPNVTLTLNRV